MSSTVKPTGSYKYFFYTVEQREITPPPYIHIPKDQLPIYLRLWKVIASRSWVQDPENYDDSKLKEVVSCVFWIKPSRERSRLTRSIYKRLSSINVPENEHVAIAEKIITKVKEGVLGVLIDVPMGNVTILDIVIPNSLELEAIIKQTPSCVICTELFEEHQQIIRLACPHHYHNNCFVRWLDVNDTCPLCRCPMPVKEVVEESL
ncbi:hypothetical protein ACLB2K_065467 [Fragaria x ananassa]